MMQYQEYSILVGKTYLQGDIVNPNGCQIFHFQIPRTQKPLDTKMDLKI